MMLSDTSKSTICTENKMNYTMNDVQLAVNLAFSMFGDKTRKGDGTPYIGHLLRVLGIVMAGGGSFRAQVGAVLHDVLEDIPGGEKIILENFGEDMVELVRECSDTEIQPKPEWKVRKIAHLEHMKHVGEDAIRILLGDKIDNGSSLCVLANYGDGLNRFNATPHEQAWYFNSVSQIMDEITVDISGISYQVDELANIAEELTDLTGYNIEIAL